MMSFSIAVAWYGTWWPFHTAAKEKPPLRGIYNHLTKSTSGGPCHICVVSHFTRPDKLLSFSWKIPPTQNHQQKDGGTIIYKKFTSQTNCFKACLLVLSKTCFAFRQTALEVDHWVNHPAHSIYIHRIIRMLVSVCSSSQDGELLWFRNLLIVQIMRIRTYCTWYSPQIEGWGLYNTKWMSEIII